MKTLTTAGLIAIVSVTGLFGQPTNFVTVDENGHSGTTSTNIPFGNALPWTVGQDPSGGLMWASTLSYTLSCPAVSGDVLVTLASKSNPTQPAQGNPIGDVLRFYTDGSGQSVLIFYATSINGYPNLANTPGPPNPFLSDIAGPYLEQGLNISGQPEWLTYTPTPGMPGWSPTMPETYTFYFDVPEPGSGLLLLALAAGCAIAIKNRNHQREQK